MDKRYEPPQTRPLRKPCEIFNWNPSDVDSFSKATVPFPKVGLTVCMTTNTYHQYEHPSSIPIRLKPYVPNRPFCFDHTDTNRFSQETNTSTPPKPKLLACHDMAGNYLEDRFIQGGHDASAYVFTHWPHIDIFNYFSHNLVTLPPPAWTNTAHRHGVKVLGTFITEGEQGRAYCKEMFSSTEQCYRTATQLVRMCRYYGFDGWLINIENTLDTTFLLVDNVVYFLTILTEMSHEHHDDSSSNSNSSSSMMIMWYDAVTIQGRLEWQDALTSLNKPFFDACDAIFLNYTWKPDTLKRTMDLAGSDRQTDVYIGVDCFGRGSIGGGGLHCDVALKYIADVGASAALFAIGWPYEDKEGWLTHMNENKEIDNDENKQVSWRERDGVFWKKIKSAWRRFTRDHHDRDHPIARRLPLHSTFSNGTGRQFFLERGKKISSSAWYNIDVQSLQPSLNIHPSDGSTGGGSSIVKAVIVINNQDDDNTTTISSNSYLHISGQLEPKSPVTVELFPVDIPLTDDMQHLEAYIVATDIPGHDDDDVTTALQVTVQKRGGDVDDGEKQHILIIPLNQSLKVNNNGDSISSSSSDNWVLIDSNAPDDDDDNEWQLYILTIDIPSHMCCPQNHITHIDLCFIPRPPDSSPLHQQEEEEEEYHKYHALDWSIDDFSVTKAINANNNTISSTVITNLISRDVEVTETVGFGGRSSITQLNAVLQWSTTGSTTHHGDNTVENNNSNEGEGDVLRYHIWYGSNIPSAAAALRWLGCTLSQQYQVTGLVLDKIQLEQGVRFVVQIENDSSGHVESLGRAASVVVSFRTSAHQNRAVYVCKRENE